MGVRVRASHELKTQTHVEKSPEKSAVHVFAAVESGEKRRCRLQSLQGDRGWKWTTLGFEVGGFIGATLFPTLANGAKERTSGRTDVACVEVYTVDGGKVGLKRTRLHRTFVCEMRDVENTRRLRSGKGTAIVFSTELNERVPTIAVPPCS